MNDVLTPREPFVFYGASELGRDALSVVEALREAGHDLDFRGFVDDGEAVQGAEVHGFPVLGTSDWLYAHRREVACLVTIGVPRVRAKLAARLEDWGVEAVTLVHPTAVIGRTVEVGIGTLVMAGVTTTVDTAIGNHVVVNPMCSLAHDVRIGDFSYLSPGVDLAGRVRLEEQAYMGISSCVLPSVVVGARATVGAGAVVLRDVAEDATVAGVPARPLD